MKHSVIFLILAACLPAGQPHFAQAGDEPVVIRVTGHGPSDTKFVTP
jgi:hypothetical protein